MKLLCRKAAKARRPQVNRATADDIRKAFLEYRDELHWLALFLTGDQAMAKACIVDACALASTQNQVFEEWLNRWARRATVRSAIEKQKSRIIQLAAPYERNPCPHQEHESLAPETVELLKQFSGSALLRIDVLCRFAIVLRGIEDYSPRESALMLNISRSALDAAYCAALESVAILNREIGGELDATIPEISSSTQVH
jgi:DNA-directed RNA polymerase specialized sigma24 family protein